MLKIIYLIEMLNIVENDNQVIISFSGDFDNINGLLVRSEAEKHIGGKHVIIDFADVFFLNSIGLRELLALKKKSILTGFEILLCNLSEDVHNILTSTGMEKIFIITHTMEEALKTF